MASPDSFDAKPILSYLALPPNYTPSPADAPIDFLERHLYQLAPEILRRFSSITTPRQRAVLAAVRNRRFRFVNADPKELSLTFAKRQWPELWEGRERRGQVEGQEEKDWAEKEFLGGGVKSHVGKLGSLLGGYEEEREAERIRSVRREQAMHDEFIPEEDDESDEEEDESAPVPPEPESLEEIQGVFLRRIRERFIYGLLSTDLYDSVDWDDTWDGNNQDDEDRWFAEEEEI
ncbi:hypothetical protein EWM64_g955 [Hericium alpestre]|uniref:CCD97-like C-terminal domain-containing protein n=1 Tax=Hericium alpestre TaxID=135208 RepID=A0A4Z0A9N8_9AGAM|nr:hypothetical protein EWM64_g955 [Hericium alpestre]